MAVRLVAPNGATADAREDAVAALLANGFSYYAEPAAKEPPKVPTRKRQARKPKE